METSTTLLGIFSDNEIIIPDYQRAFSWDVSDDDSKPLQVNTYLNDIDNYINSSSKSPYYFGHFLFETKGESQYAIIDGQQRLTTSFIFISAIFNHIQQGGRKLTDEEELLYKRIIKFGAKYHFSTVRYDNQFFRDCVIGPNNQMECTPKTESQKRILQAYNFFSSKIQNATDKDLNNYLSSITGSLCTTHIVTNEAEAIQMFIFQNNRGKRPSNLEIIKAQFMYYIHLHGGQRTEECLAEIKNRFENIYQSISSVENRINEDTVLVYSQQVFFNSLWETNPMERISNELSEPNKLDFVIDFIYKLQLNFDYITRFLGEDEKDNNINVHSLIVVGGLRAEIMPFILKAYQYRLNKNDFTNLCKALETLVIRDRLIGTRADLTSRLNDQFKAFEGNINPIVTFVEVMKTTKDIWLSYWNNEHFISSIQGWIKPELAKILLWKYENYLITKEGKGGYKEKEYTSIVSPHLEHIAPQTENNEQIATGYCEYDEDFYNNYLDCLGNYLLLSAPHNESIGNKPFETKRKSYNQLRQQIEVYEMTEHDHIWDKDKIKTRQEKIVNFIKSIY